MRQAYQRNIGTMQKGAILTCFQVFEKLSKVMKLINYSFKE